MFYLNMDLFDNRHVLALKTAISTSSVAKGWERISHSVRNPLWYSDSFSNRTRTLSEPRDMEINVVCGAADPPRHKLMPQDKTPAPVTPRPAFQHRSHVFRPAPE